MKEEIIIFGIGKYFEHKKAILERYNVVCIIDNKIAKGSFEYYESTDTKVINPADLYFTPSMKIFMMSMHFIGMWRQLVSLGIDAGQLVYPYFEKPYFQSDEVVDYYVDCMEFQRDKIIINHGDKIIFDENDWEDYLRFIYRDRYPLIPVLANMDTKPISTQFATERGTPVDRYYIDKFLGKYSGYIAGDVLEIEDNNYTKKFGGEVVKNAIVMDVGPQRPGITFVANLETGEGIRDEIADCFILTQTLMYIFDLKTAVKNIKRLLKPNGVVLITCSGISQNSKRCMDSYGAYFNFNEAAFERMFEEEKNMQIVTTGSFGNVKTVSAHINGLCCEDLQDVDFDLQDKCYPLIVYAVVRKSEK